MMTIHSIRCGSHWIRANVTSDPAAADRWVHEILQRNRHLSYRLGRLVVGVGVQWVSRHAATLQLCVRSSCLIFQLHHADHCPDALRSFLVDPNVILVALWDNAIAGMLWSSPHALWMGRLRGSRRGATMEQLAEEILGIPGMRMDEAVACSDWEAQELTYEQVEYACHAVLLPFLMASELRLWEYFL